MTPCPRTPGAIASCRPSSSARCSTADGLARKPARASTSASARDREIHATRLATHSNIIRSRNRGLPSPSTPSKSTTCPCACACWSTPKTARAAFSATSSATCSHTPPSASPKSLTASVKSIAPCAGATPTSWARSNLGRAGLRGPRRMESRRSSPNSDIPPEHRSTSVDWTRTVLRLLGDTTSKTPGSGRSSRPVRTTGASLVDLGDGVLCGRVPQQDEHARPKMPSP